MPVLTILAGPNGAGKTRNSDFLLQQHLIPCDPVDLDLLKEQAINNLPHSIYGVEQRLANTLDKFFKDYCVNAIKNKDDFCYECNFRRDQLIHVGLFEAAGYKLNLIYFTLNSIEQSQQRVKFRSEHQNGKNVDFKSIEENFCQGLQNLDNGYENFNHILIIDNSQDNYTLKNTNILNIQLSIEDGKFECFSDTFPSKDLITYLPNITKQILYTK